jgi:hypothetical protein
MKHRIFSLLYIGNSPATNSLFKAPMAEIWFPPWQNLPSREAWLLEATASSFIIRRLARFTATQPYRRSPSAHQWSGVAMLMASHLSIRSIS